MSPAGEVAAAMAASAARLLESLDPEQLALAAWPFPSDAERRLWFYTPTDHGGLPLGRCSPRQQQLAMRLLATGLSRPGYVTAATIIGLENVLDELEGWGVHWSRERGRDPGLYFVRVFGDPAAGGDWSWRFGGHHVSVQHLVRGSEVASSTPLFLGADPAASPLLGPGELRPLGGAEDLGRELLHALDSEDRRRAVIAAVAPFDLVGGNRPRLAGDELPLRLPEVWRGRFEGEVGDLIERLQQQLEETLGTTAAELEAVRLTRAPKGIPLSALSAAQRELARELLRAHLGRLPVALAAARLEAYAGDALEGLSFAWAGGIERGMQHYYRLQGPRLLIEYDNAQRSGNHAHSVLRDPVGDFGYDVLREHHRGELPEAPPPSQ